MDLYAFNTALGTGLGALDAKIEESYTPVVLIFGPVASPLLTVLPDNIVVKQMGFPFRLKKPQNMI